MLWFDAAGAMIDVESPPEAQPSIPSRVSSDLKPPELPPIVEEERQPPRKQSNLIYKRTQLPTGVEVSVIAKPGRCIDEVIRFEPADGDEPVIKIITRRQPGRPTKLQTNGGDHAV